MYNPINNYGFFLPPIEEVPEPLPKRARLDNSLVNSLPILTRPFDYQDTRLEALNTILNQWCDPQLLNSEQRNEAAHRIRQCYRKKGVKLNLSNLRLSSLPSGLEKFLLHVKILYLEENNLTS